MLRKLLFPGLTSLFVLYGIGLFTNGIQAAPVPQAFYPAGFESCIRNSTIDSSCDFNATVADTMDLAVGDGEHTSNATSVEIYASATKEITINITSAGFCADTNPNPAGVDFGATFTTRYRVFLKVDGSAVGASLADEEVTTSCADFKVAFNATAGATYELRATAVGASNAENLYSLNIEGGGATIGAGTTSGGGLSFANRDIPLNYVTDYNMYFATTCDYSSSERIGFFDADKGKYQSVGNYPDLNWFLDERTRDSGAAWSNTASGTANSADGESEEIASPLEADKEYRLRIRGLSRPNALEVSLPDDVSQRFVEVACPDPVNAECSISLGAGTSLLGGRRYIEPNTAFNATVNVNNIGGVAISDADGFEIREIESGVEWNPLSPNNGSNRVPIPSGSIAPGANRDITFTATSPSISVTNPTARTFAWQVYQNGSPVGDSCSATLYIAEKYDIQPPTGVSSLGYVQPNQAFNWPYTYTFDNDGAGASRDGPSFSDDGVVDLRFRYLVNGSVVSGVPAPSIDDVTISGDSDRSWAYTAGVPNSVLTEIGDEICVEGRARFRHGWEGGPITATGTTPGTANYRWTDWGEIACTKAADQAYFEVQNGSVWSGGSFDALASGFGTDWCVTLGSGEINTVRGNGVGAWADYVAGAVAQIESFGSAHIRGGQIDGTELTFANRIGGAATEGNFGQGRCITDFAKYLASDTTRTDIDLLPTGTSWPTGNGQWVRTGDLDIGAHTLGAGEKYTIIVQGDVTINGDLRFSYSATDVADIPSLIIVATGDIAIDGSVEQIDGFYFAKGTIDTCGDAGARLSVTTCRDKLRVNGVFAARDVEFRRTHGGISGANIYGGNAEAELFVFNSELYLAQHILISDFQAPLPIAQQQELPPVLN